MEQDKSIKGIVREANRLLHPIGWRAISDKKAERFAEALSYEEVYWHNAGKRIDIRELNGFGPIAAHAVAEHRTGMRHDRLYTIWQAIAGMPPGSFPMVEVGAFKGGSARFIGGARDWHGRSNPFYVCDTFRGHAAVDAAVDGSHQIGVQFIDTSRDDVAAYLEGLANVTLVEGDFRATSAQLEPLAPFAFVHLDVDVYPVMRHALDFFAPRMHSGSVIVVDDYGFTTCRGTREAVDEFTPAHREFRAFHLLTGQALLVRLG